MLSVSGLTKRYRDRVALDGVDLAVGRGEVVGLLGENGAGKTTLVSIIAGLRRADSGAVSINDVDALKRPSAARRLFGLVPQELGIYPTLTARDNLRYFGGLCGLKGADLARSIDRTADAMQIGPLLGRRSHELSGGEKRRLHTAIAMLHRPPLLLLDEPTVGVDVRTRQAIVEAVAHLASEGTAICYSTHYLAEVEALQASVAILHHGRLLARGSLASLIAEHGEPALELSFDGDAPQLPGLEYPHESDGPLLRVFTKNPATVAPIILSGLPATPRLRSLEVVGASLEAVFLTLTGRRYHASENKD